MCDKSQEQSKLDNRSVDVIEISSLPAGEMVTLHLPKPGRVSKASSLTKSPASQWKGQCLY
jgi:hypothetical protein